MGILVWSYFFFIDKKSIFVLFCFFCMASARGVDRDLLASSLCVFICVFIYVASARGGDRELSSPSLCIYICVFSKNSSHYKLIDLDSKYGLFFWIVKWTPTTDNDWNKYTDYPRSLELFLSPLGALVIIKRLYLNLLHISVILCYYYVQNILFNYYYLSVNNSLFYLWEISNYFHYSLFDLFPLIVDFLHTFPLIFTSVLSIVYWYVLITTMYACSIKYLPVSALSKFIYMFQILYMVEFYSIKNKFMFWKNNYFNPNCPNFVSYFLNTFWRTIRVCMYRFFLFDIMATNNFEYVNINKKLYSFEKFNPFVKTFFEIEFHSTINSFEILNWRHILIKYWLVSPFVSKFYVSCSFGFVNLFLHTITSTFCNFLDKIFHIISILDTYFYMSTYMYFTNIQYSLIYNIGCFSKNLFSSPVFDIQWHL